jgi:6-phosphogluconolactonase
VARCAIVLSSAVFAAAYAPAGDSYVYVSLDSLQCIGIYRIDPSSGDLKPVKNVEAGGQPGSLAVDPTHRFLHAAIRSKNSVASFRINPETGDLSLIGRTSVTWNPVYLAVDRTGRYLFTAHFADHRAAVYAIGQYGAVQGGALQVITTPQNPHSIRTDCSNRYLFIPCRSGETILTYRFNDTTGVMSPGLPDRIATPDSIGPRHIVVHPFLNLAYVANEFEGSVTAYRLDSLNGALARLQTLSMQIADAGGTPGPAHRGGADVHMTPDGRFLYATNRGPNSIAAYRLDPATGVMTFIAHYPTETMPRSFAIDPAGRFLYAGGQRSGRLAAYKIDAGTGRLTLFNTYQVGKNPVWVLIVHVADQGLD